MRAAWWWIDRWRTSSAFTTLTLAEQGAYRNLIDELWLRDGVLPDNDRLLSMASGAGGEWPAVREAVMRYFVKTPEGWRNPTHDSVAADSKAHRDRQAEKGRARASAAPRVGGRFVAGGVSPAEHQPGVQPPSLDLDLDQTLDQDQIQSMSGGPDERDEVEDKADQTETIKTIWNEVAAPAGLPTCRVLNDKRKRVIRRALKDYPDPGFWRRVFTLIAADPHCRGAEGGSWKASIDYPFQSNAVRWIDKALVADEPPPVVAEPEPYSVRMKRSKWESMRRSLAEGRILDAEDTAELARLDAQFGAVTPVGRIA